MGIASLERLNVPPVGESGNYDDVAY